MLQQLLGLLWQFWQAIGWNGISAIAALILALDAMRKHSNESTTLPPSSYTPYLKQPRKSRRQKRRRKKRVP